MLKNVNGPRELKETMLSLLPTSGTLAGIAVGLSGFVNVGAKNRVSSLADEILLFSALGFLVVCYLILFCTSIYSCFKSEANEVAKSLW